jgi:hypothetical protein
MLNPRKALEKIMINKLRDSEKKIVHVDRKPYTFYSSEKRRLTFYVDEYDNVIDVYNGIFEYLDDNILTVSDGVQHSSYYDISTGNKLFTNFTDRDSSNVILPFINGIALVHDWNRHIYDVLNNKGEIISNCAWLYRINKKILFVKNNRIDENYSLYDYDFNIIKENVSCDYRDIRHNEDYILAARKETEKIMKYFIIDAVGNAVSNEYNMLETNDFETFEYKLGKEKGKITLDELINK